MRRLRWSAAFIVAGMLIQIATLLWSHPAAFLFHVLIGGAIQALGIAIYILAIVHPGRWKFLDRFRPAAEEMDEAIES